MPTKLFVPLVFVTTPSTLNACFSPLVATPIARNSKNHVLPVAGSGILPLKVNPVAVPSVVCAPSLFITSLSPAISIVSVFCVTVKLLSLLVIVLN